MRLILIIFNLLLLIPNSLSQVKVLNGGESIISKSRSDIDIKIVNNNILMPVDLGRGLVLYFILDTGVKTTIITDPIIIDLLDIPMVSTKLNYRLNQNYKFENQDVIILKEAIDLDQHLGEPVYGIIGYDFMKNHEVTINFAKQKMLIKDPKNEKKIERLKRKKNIQVYNIDFEGSKPFISAPITNGEKSDSLKLLIDTGFNGAINLYPNKKTESYLAEPMINNYQGYGMNGLILSKFKKLKSISIGKSNVLKEVSTHFIDSSSLINVSHSKFSDGSIGNDILSRFVVSLDYKNEKMYLRPIKSKLKAPFSYNRAGIRVLYNFTLENDEHFLIQSIREDSEADKAGLKPKDILIAINEKMTKKMTLAKIYESLNNNEIRDKKLLILRGGKEIEITFEVPGNIEWN